MDVPTLPAHPKILARQDLEACLAPLRGKGRIVFTNGCFDLLHAGHVDLLARARVLGDALVVGVNSDESVRRLGKDPGRPLTPLAQRLFVLAALACVDFVVPFDEDTPYELIKALRPDVLVKGGDWPVQAIVGRDIVAARGGDVLSLPLVPGLSTTEIIKRIRKNEGRPKQ